MGAPYYSEVLGWVVFDPRTDYVSGGTEHYDTAAEALAAAVPNDVVCALVAADEYDRLRAASEALARIEALDAEESD